MLAGTVTDDGVPVIMLLVAGQMWPAIIDTGFNGGLELPESMRRSLQARFIGRMSSLLAGDQSVEEDVALVQLNGDIFLFYNKSLGDLNVEKFTHKHSRRVDGVDDVWHAYPPFAQESLRRRDR